MGTLPFMVSNDAYKGSVPFMFTYMFKTSVTRIPIFANQDFARHILKRHRRAEGGQRTKGLLARFNRKDARHRLAMLHYQHFVGVGKHPVGCDRPSRASRIVSVFIAYSNQSHGDTIIIYVAHASRFIRPP